MPNGLSIVLEHQPGADSAGYAGLEDEVDYHWGNLVTAAAISTLLGISSELVLNSNNAVVEALRTGAENAVNQTGQTKLGALVDDNPVKLPAQVHRDLVAYAEALASESGQAVDTAKLVAPMLARFMATDLAFAKARRDIAPKSQSARAAE